MNRLAIAAALLVASGLGFGLARMVPSAPAPVARAVVERAPTESSRDAIDQVAMRAAIRAAIREELVGVQKGDAPAAVAEVETAADTKPEPTPEQLAARDTADRIVAKALAAGVWRDADREALAQVPRLTTAQKIEALHPLMLAMNQDRLRVDVAQFPFDL